MHRIDALLCAALFVVCEVASVAFSVRLAVRLGGLEPVLLAAVLELGKLALSVAGVRRWRDGHRRAAGGVLALAGGLGVLSAGASAAYLDEAAEGLHRRAAGTAERLEALDEGRALLRAEAAVVLAAAKGDVGHGYRARALEGRRAVAGIRAELEELAHERAAVATGDAATGATVAAAVAARHRRPVAVVLAVVLELLCLAALSLLAERRPAAVATGGQPEAGAVATRDRTADATRDRTAPDGEDESMPTGSDTDATGDELEELTAKLWDLLRAGAVRPVLTDVRKALGCRQAHARAAMTRLVKAGALVREGRRYRLADG